VSRSRRSAERWEESSCNRTKTTQVVVKRSDTLSPEHGKIEALINRDHEWI
jgi:hypothetical protein